MASPLLFGQVTKFQPDTESIETYEEQIKMFFTANQIPEERQVAVLLSVIGSAHFSFLSSLLAPDKPADKSVAELLTVLKEHFASQSQRYKFYNPSQQAGESATQ